MVFAHELGHNLGMHHASTDINNDGIIDSEYADGSCIMGNSGLKGMNGAHAAQLGVYAAFTGKVLTGQIGYTELAAVDLQPLATSLPQVLKIKKINTNDYYYITYRAPYNYGVNLSATYSKRLNIHRYTGSGSTKTTYIRSLGVGEVFSDIINGIVITAGSISADGTSMGVNISADCVSQPPTLTVNPSTTFVYAGSNNLINVNLKNNDSDLCPATTFALQAIAPIGVSAVLTNSSVSLLPGVSQTISMSVSSLLTSGSGVVSVIAQDSDGLIPTHTDVQSLLTVTVDSTAPTAPINLTSTFKQNKVQLSWSASTDTGSGVASYLVYVNNVLLGTTTTTNFLHSPGSSGTYSYYVIAKDKAGNLSLPSAVHTRAVSITSGGKPRR